MAEAATKLPVNKEKGPSVAARERWSPFDPLHSEFDRLFEGLHPFGWPRRSLFDRGVEGTHQSAWTFSPAMDLVEKDNGYEVSAELPGLDEQDIEIKLSNGTLVIKGEKSEEKEQRDKEYYLSERRFGSFQRSFTIPRSVDTEKIEANFAKGVLTVTLPKSAEAKQQEKTIGINKA